MIGNLLKKIFGDKSAKDKKLYWPYVEQDKEIEVQIKNLSDDELRTKTSEFKLLIQEDKLSLENEISELLKEADNQKGWVLQALNDYHIGFLKGLSGAIAFEQLIA